MLCSPPPVADGTELRIAVLTAAELEPSSTPTPLGRLSRGRGPKREPSSGLAELVAPELEPNPTAAG
eukprot:5468327-Alexandrium_andersonii.AAC.1